MSDEFAAMTQKEMMRMLYALQKESVENDARLQSQLEELMKQQESRDAFLDKISDAVSEQKILIAQMSGVDGRVEGVDKKLDSRVKSIEGSIEGSIKILNKKIDSLVEWKNEQEKKQALEDKDDDLTEAKVDRLFNWKDEASKKIEALENKGARTVFSLVKKIGAIALGLIVTAIVSYLIGKFKGN